MAEDQHAGQNNTGRRKPSDAASLERIKKFVGKKFPQALLGNKFRGKTKRNVYRYTSTNGAERYILTSVSQDGNQTAISKGVANLLQEGDSMVFALKECPAAVFVIHFSANVLETIKHADSDRGDDFHHIDVEHLADRNAPRTVLLRCANEMKISVAVEEVSVR